MSERGNEVRSERQAVGRSYRVLQSTVKSHKMTSEKGLHKPVIPGLIYPPGKYWPSA